eukprot:CAMPEP_0115272058 /NCGR_PEP_ID=MMETSP0270-20121206/54425_1 /TAXON_ID=71861 /ORGANISM="Scrippsiella trochoidea, Strain CCMP3099" /LENGTH=128 /DNA_ID=CAMNT_0002688449 /DNA_START=143 /DNA_END=526 /DNA_ORIENTATION=+
MLLLAREAFHVVGVVPFGDRPLLCEALETLAGVLAPTRVVQSGLGEQVALDEVGVAKADAAPEHAVLSPGGLAHVLVAFRSYICEVNPKAIHVAPIPVVLLSAVLAPCAAQGRTQPFATGCWASLRRT